MSVLIASVIMNMLKSVVTQTFFSKMLVIGLKKWADSTDNHYDDEVVKAIADSLGVDKSVIDGLNK